METYTRPSMRLMPLLTTRSRQQHIYPAGLLGLLRKRPIIYLVVASVLANLPLLLLVACSRAWQTASSGISTHAAIVSSAATGQDMHRLQPTEGPYRFPRLIHQTVASEDRMSCQELKIIRSWKRLNPGYIHRLWDDTEMREFMLQHYPELVPVPYDLFLNAAERTDLWRVLVLHQYGGVYADIDVQALRPIDDWNANHHHDASILIGTEDSSSDWTYNLRVTNWVMAAMPGHPLLAKLPGIVARQTQKQFHEFWRIAAATVAANETVDSAFYEDGILSRTGPGALREAVREYFQEHGVNLTATNYSAVVRPQGLIAGGSRLLPLEYFGSGWVVALARQRNESIVCEEVGKRMPDALVCHMFCGTWRSEWSIPCQQTYGNCEED